MKALMKVAKHAATAAALSFAMSAQATPVVGTANLTFGLVDVSLGEIDWNPPINPGPAPLGSPTYGSFVTHPLAVSGSFLSVAGSAGLIQDMSAGLFGPDANYMPVGLQPSPVAKFLQFAMQPGWLFSATFLSPGTFPGTPYVLTEVDGNVSATITVKGTICDTGGDSVCDVTDDITKWTGILSAQYTNATIASLAAIILGGGHLANNTWSGTITAVPEPGSLALIGLALAGLGASMRRRKALA